MSFDVSCPRGIWALPSDRWLSNCQPRVLHQEGLSWIPHPRCGKLSCPFPVFLPARLRQPELRLPEGRGGGAARPSPRSRIAAPRPPTAHSRGAAARASADPGRIGRRGRRSGGWGGDQRAPPPAPPPRTTSPGSRG